MWPTLFRASCYLQGKFNRGALGITSISLLASPDDFFQLVMSFHAPPLHSLHVLTDWFPISVLPRQIYVQQLK